MPTTISVPGRPSALTAGKLLCIGRNYAAHAAEMKSPVPVTPMVFLKPASAIIPSGGSIVLPNVTADVHHEVEMVAVIGKGGKDITADHALSHIAGYGVGLDMTARDIQATAKAKGHPWTVSKGFDSFAPLGGFVPADSVANPQDLVVELKVNGEVRQHGNTADMIFPVAALVAYCSTIMTLEPGDLIYTGTPEGVGPVVAGDVLEATISGMPVLRVTVTR